MKKTYISPAMDVVEFEQQTLLAGSFVNTLDTTGGDGSEALAPENGLSEWEF